MLDAHYENPGIAELYDLGNPWSVDRDFYLSLAGSPRSRILDLGCGTGLLCDAYAALNHDVTGVDPSAAMLEIARRKPHGNAIEWVQSSAQNYRSDKLFDLIVMTGHAFQVLLEDADVLATFMTMRKHLSAGGVVAFESRNPAIDWAARWNYDIALESRRGAVHESRRFIAMENGRMTFELDYRFPDESFVSRSELRFSSRNEIVARLTACGLRARHVLGDWDGTAFDETRSHEMIFIAGAAS
jgi:SAM-dependent methyltransferase